MISGVNLTHQDERSGTGNLTNPHQDVPGYCEIVWGIFTVENRVTLQKVAKRPLGDLRMARERLKL